MNERISKKIRIITFLSIVMVVFLHSYNLEVKYADTVNSQKGLDINTFLQTFISHGISNIAVPIFFTVSGFLFFLNFEPSIKGYMEKFKKRSKSLLIPYLLWNIWGIIFYFILQSIPLSKPFFSNDLVRQYTIQDFVDKVLVHPLPYQLWFIRDLIFFVIISPIIYFLISRIPYVSLIFALVAWTFNVDPIVFSNQGILFFSIGSFISIKRAYNILEYENMRGLGVLSLLWLVVLIIQTVLACLDNNGYQHIEKVTVLVGVFVFWMSYANIKMVKDNNRLLYFSQYTFFIFAAHKPLLNIQKKLFLRVLSVSTVSSFIVYVLIPFTTITVLLVTGILLRKYTTRFYKVITGNRLH